MMNCPSSKFNAQSLIARAASGHRQTASSSTQWMRSSCAIRYRRLFFDRRFFGQKGLHLLCYPARHFCDDGSCSFLLLLQIGNLLLEPPDPR